MAEGLVYGVVKLLGSIATKQGEQEIRLVVGVDKEVKKLEVNLKAVVALLNDAEKKQFTDEAVKHWLEELNDVCYEMEDVADEWNTELIKAAIQKEEEENGDVWLQVCSFISSLSCGLGKVHEVSRRHDIALKIKELKEKLDEIAERKDRYRFQSTNEPAPKVDQPADTSFFDASEIYGRESIKDDLVVMLRGHTTKKIAISDGQSSSKQHKKPSQISIVDGKRPSTAVGKSLVDNTILSTRSLLTLIFDSTTPS